METRNAVSEHKTIRGREIAALLNPRPVVLVTCCDAEGKPNVFSLAWHTPLSHDPALVGISIGRSHYSHSLIQATGEFVINIVGQGLLNAVVVCGNHSGADGDKSTLADLKLERARWVQAPLIADALGYLECRVAQEVSCGDHTLFVGHVIDAVARPDCFSDEWDLIRGDVLLCRQRDHFGHCVAAERAGE